MRITNCHIHTFLDDHVPKDFPHWLVKPVRRRPRILKFIAWGARFLQQREFAEQVDRLHAFVKESAHKDQDGVLAALMPHYPQGTRFVILPMELAGFGYGTPDVLLRQQHDDLARLADSPRFKGLALPFATLDPRVDLTGAELWRAIEEHGFHGIKLYPRLGFAPDDAGLMKNVYPKANETLRHGRPGLPIMTHCSRGGAKGRGLSEAEADRVTSPAAFIPVLEAFPNLRICLAHFGGLRDWKAYANPDDHDLPADAENWLVMIRKMIGDGKYPGLWTDISYTMFEFDEFIPFLRVLLTGDDDWHERLRRRVLFGSDFYMTRQEELSEREVCIRLRSALGEEVFTQIAETNPEIWLGERPDPPSDLWTETRETISPQPAMDPAEVSG